ncbi:TPA: hypothetical protein N0F65_001024 [Lagenidium giganteum]|uniref:Protein kinase domain-containing protein n=1 Tax=Lagenidium giganteum TaxID=4803 RepID=A0AAV2YX58_9STRA|nr:TPA: hypothetical protein N0F65_001024 [Lagenidium giganteum]
MARNPRTVLLLLSTKQYIPAIGDLNDANNGGRTITRHVAAGEHSLCARLLRTIAFVQDYELVEFLGQGSTAQVYAAVRHRANDDARVAIKVIDKLLIEHQDLKARVQQEMLLHAELDHPCVLKVLSTFEDSRNMYMVLELCERRSLTEELKQRDGGVLDEHTARRVFRQLVHGVQYLHSQSVIHRDLKLSNVLLTADERVKISDFGLATRAGSDALHTTMCGTPNFMAPEVLKQDDKRAYDAAVDIWSLGCILFALLLGLPPFQGQRVSDTLANVVNSKRQPVQFPPGFSASASDLIKRLLQHDPRRRPLPHEILLHPWLKEPKTSLSPLLPQPPPTARRRSITPKKKTRASTPPSDRPPKPRTPRTPRTPRPTLENPEIVSVVLRVPVTGLAVLGSDGTEQELEWQCVDERVLGTVIEYRFKTTNGTTGTYSPRGGVLRVSSTDGSTAIEHRWNEKQTLATTVTTPPPSNSEQLGLLRLCQCLAMRALELRRQALQMDPAQWPLVHYDTLPDKVARVVSAFANRETAVHEQLEDTKHQDELAQARASVRSCEVHGVGVAVVHDDGGLSIVFIDGSRLALDASGAVLKYRRTGAENTQTFQLSATSGAQSLPTEARQKLECVPQFIRRLRATH